MKTLEKNKTENKASATEKKAQSLKVRSNVKAGITITMTDILVS